MKQKSAVLALIAIMFAILASGTYAYFTTEDTARNVITSGYVDIELVEKHENEDGTVVDFPDKITGVMPGSSVSKIVSVTNTGAKSWIRLAVELKVTAKDGTELPTDVISYTVDETKWLVKDGVYYYRQPVETGAPTDILFDQVNFSTAMGNEYQNCEVNLIVTAQAVQFANNGTTVEEAAGWPEL